MKIAHRLCWFTMGVITGLTIGATALLVPPTPVETPTPQSAEPPAQHTPSRAEPESPEVKYNKIENCAITGYAPELVEAYKHMNSDGNGRYLTASGEWVYLGEAVAVDPTVIPLGATVIVGDQTYTALDTGVKGNVVDIMMSAEEALQYGVHYEDVYWYLEVE